MLQTQAYTNLVRQAILVWVHNYMLHSINCLQLSMRVYCRNSEKVSVARCLVSHMLEKSPLKYPFARSAACMSPNVLVDRNKKELCMLEKLVSSGRITVRGGDEAKDQYHRFIDDIVPHNKKSFFSFNKFDNMLDTFHAEFLSDKEFKSLWKVCILAFCLSHGQSAVERGFIIMTYNDQYPVIPGQLTPFS